MLYPAELRGRRQTVYPQQATGAKIQAPKNTLLKPSSVFQPVPGLQAYRATAEATSTAKFHDYFVCRINALSQFPRLAHVNSENIDGRF
jgi:hypothetical protein